MQMQWRAREIRAQDRRTPWRKMSAPLRRIFEQSAQIITINALKYKQYSWHENNLPKGFV
ncbi:hypothetical protein AB4037_29870 [Labrys sp. KB_33_2]|uniref:hypothetical protein n=1 Tax=Labrys sp. KB_33_2 TaxID=3237479 RepID=UPI003F8EBA89